MKRFVYLLPLLLGCGQTSDLGGDPPEVSAAPGADADADADADIDGAANEDADADTDPDPDPDVDANVTPSGDAAPPDDSLDTGLPADDDGSLDASAPD